MTQRLRIFTRYPEPGRTKTRLAPALGPEGAALLQRAMTRHVLRRVDGLADEPGVDVEVLFEGGDEQKMRDAFGSRFAYRRQETGDLGQRMDRAFHRSHAEASGPTVVIGADCPDVDTRVVRQAFYRLKKHDLVLGPASDGGYYLIGLNRPTPELFQEIAWGGEEVLARTLAVAGELGLTHSLLETLDDVDVPEDLPVWSRARDNASPEGNGRISIIIPTRDEEISLPVALHRPKGVSDVEVIVVDANSEDATIDIAVAEGATTLTGVEGRARQMNAGAMVAEGEFLVFLHADTILPRDFERQVRRLLAQPNTAAGAFRFRLDQRRPYFKLVEMLTNLRAKWLQMPYGDQAIFLRSRTFHQLGGFTEMPIMEDFDLVRRAKRLGRIRLAQSSAVTSARRWRRMGLLRTTWRNQRILAGYHFGVSPKRLARWYEQTES